MTTDGGGRLAVLSAGGTGGHLFPAAALADALKERGWRVHLMTDARAEKYADTFPAEQRHIVASATPSGGNPLKLLSAALTVLKGTMAARRLLTALRPAVVVGFGGYPTVPPLLAATMIGVPSVIHEQNAVMGRANALLASRVTAIAGGFLEPHGAHASKMVLTGNPVRPAVIAASKTDYRARGTDGRFHLVVFGGSQGARFFAETIPAAIAKLSEEHRANLKLTLQARPEDRDVASDAVRGLGVTAEVESFFSDMPARIADAQFVISRSGASTVSEVAAIGRPALFIPYPHALDHDQAANAARLAASGAVEVRRQDTLDPDGLAHLIVSAMEGPDDMVKRAALARSAGQPDATRLLAELVEAIADGKSPAAFQSDAA